MPSADGGSKTHALEQPIEEVAVHCIRDLDEAGLTLVEAGRSAMGESRKGEKNERAEKRHSA